MPRPSTGYRNSAGQVIPGAGDITGRFCPKDGLIGWAYNRGKAGLPRSTQGDIDIGNITHMMCEMDMHGATFDDIDGYLDRTPIPYADRAKVVKCFAGYRSWRTTFPIRPVLQEKPLVSERHQYGGTPDLIGMTPKGLAMVDYKTSSKGQPYLDHLVHMAAHGHLWLENGGDPLDGGYHLLLLPKDGSPFRHIRYSQEQINPFWKLFEIWREVFDLDQACQKAEALEGAKTVDTVWLLSETMQERREFDGLHVPAAPPPQAAERPGTADRPRPVRPTTRPKEPVARLIHSPPPPMTMGELLRAYEHVPAIA